MISKIKKPFSLIIFAVFVIGALISCKQANSKIVGTWKNVDEKITAVETFSANGNYTLKSPINPKTFSGKYEISDNLLTINFLDENGRKQFDNKYKIIDLSDGSMTLELPDGTKMSYRKQ